MCVESKPARDFFYSAGIDENGLGPVLGPLVITGAATNIPHERMDPLKRPGPGFPGLRDSKKIFSRRSMKRGEALALSIVRVIQGRAPSSFMDLLDALGRRDAAGQPLPCRGAVVHELCFHEDIGLPLWAGAGDVEAAAGMLARLLGEAGFESGCVISTQWCPFLLNAEARRGRNKFNVDLESMIDIVLSLQSRLGGRVDVVAGKVGSRILYEDEILGRSGRAPEIIARSREESSYRLKDGTGIRFIKDADEKFVHVSMASIVGKYVREVFMESIHRFAVKGCGPVRRPSGYRDKFTREFIRNVKPFLARSGIDPRCFEREK